MYLTAHRVVAPRATATGINAFLYLHPGRTWRVPPSQIPDIQHGLLTKKNIVVKPPGNRVRSYIDIVAPDDIEIDELMRRLKLFLRRVHGLAMPWEAVEGPCLFRVGMDSELARSWLSEVAALTSAARALLGP